MSRTPIIATLSLLLLAPASAQPPTPWTAAQSMGLYGAVHTQRVTSKKLNPEPRPEAKLFINHPSAWVVFDPSGRITEQASASDADGHIVSLTRVAYDAQNKIESSSDGHNQWRTETDPTHPGQVKSFRNGVLFSVQTQTFDARGNLAETSTVDANGELMSRATYAFDEQGRNNDWQVWGPHNQFILHMADRFNDEGELLQRSYLDESGKPISTFSLQGDQLTNYWQAAQCNCSHNVGLSRGGVTTTYETEADGSLQVTVQNHPNSPGNLELDDTERFSADHTLLEKLTYTYERDAQGNWTKRIISALDPSTGAMVPIQEDDRVLTYY